MPLAQGGIVWVTIPDSQGGNPKKRPAVIVSATADIGSGGFVRVAAITTDVGRTRSSDTVAVPTLPAGHPETKLKKPCEVVCSWVARVAISDVNDTGGHLPTSILAEVLLKVKHLAG